MRLERGEELSRSQSRRAKALTSILTVSQGYVTLHSKITHFQKHVFFNFESSIYKKMDSAIKRGALTSNGFFPVSQL